MTIERIGLSLERDGTAPADIHFDNGNLVMVKDAKAVGQHARQRLMTFEEEWFLDKQVGVPWLLNVLGLKYDPVLAESVIKTELLDTDGVEEITSFSVRFDREKRQLSAYSIDVTTDYDEEVNV